MMAADKKRLVLVWGALLATLAATAWVAASDDAGEDAVLARNQARVVATTTVSADTAASVSAYQPRALIENEPQDLFPGDTLPEEETKPAPPPKPTTPPLPFSYAGKLVEDGHFIVFLTHGTRNLTVHAGDVIDGIWRIESIRPPTMVVAYLPLKTEVPLGIGETN